MKKRSVERIPVQGKAQFQWSDTLNSVLLVDISEKGMLINTGTCPPLRARFEVHIPIDDEVVKVPVKVRRVIKKDTAYEGVGLEVLNPPKKYLDFVSTLRWKHIKGLKAEREVMKLYACKICSHISFDHAPIICPICSSAIENFEKAPDAIQHPEIATDLSEFEKKHIPTITTSKDNGYISVYVNIGEIQHELDVDDHISFIDFYFNSPLMNKKCLSRMSFNCENMQPFTSLRFKHFNEGVLTAISKCNLHGYWLSETVI